LVVYFGKWFLLAFRCGCTAPVAQETEYPSFRHVVMVILPAIIILVREREIERER
jgi:hypothetical protein